MKKRKHTLITFILCCSIALLFTGCSGGSKPSNNQILEDLSASFASRYEDSYNMVMDIVSFDVELSESDEKVYNADIVVTAKSKSNDVEFYWNANVEYYKYDQGWKIEDCSWDYDYSIKVVKYPDKKELSKIISDTKGENVKVEETKILKDESKIVCSISNEANWSQYGSGKAMSDLTLEYGALYGWREDTETYTGSKFNLSKKLVNNYSFKIGKYVETGNSNIYVESEMYMKTGNINISNVTDNGLDISFESSSWNASLNTPKIHFDIESVIISEDNIRVKFKDTANIAYNGNDKGTASLYIDLNKASDPNGDLEIEFFITSSATRWLGYAVYSNTSK